MAQDATTKVHSILLSSDAAAELVQFTAYRVARGQYVPLVLMNIADGLAEELGVEE